MRLGLGLRSLSHALTLAVLGAVVGGWPSFSQSQEQNACASCHDQGKKLQASAHAQVGCPACHSKHEKYPHPVGIAKASCNQCHAGQSADHAKSVHGLALKRGNTAAPDCGVCHGTAHELVPARSTEFSKTVPSTCGMCHDEISKKFLTSVHGKALERGVKQAPICTDCHGEHSIQAHTNPASSVHVSHVRETCGRCHDNVRLTQRFGIPSDRVVSFDASYHGLASAAGSQTVANCASCHGVHNILASSDPESTVNPKNLPATCGHCHQGAGTRFALGPVHVWRGRVEPVPVRVVRQGYLILIPILIGLMILHNAGDWFRKLMRLRFSPRPEPPNLITRVQTIRMLPFERILHAALVVSFVVLAWTGFQLKYPEQWWARPMLSWEVRWSVRGFVHRSAAVVFMAVAVMHVVSLIASGRLRVHWRELWPRRSDVAEALGMFAYNLGLSNQRPKLSSYSYIEKAEYWAVVWGAFVMGLTGVLLWADNFVLRLFPKQLLDLATALHFYEAVLACLAIVVWHFYLVIFDPEVYPVDTTWLTGRSVRQHHSGPEPQMYKAVR